MGYFHASKLLKLVFLSSLTRKYVLWKGFYHDFSTKKASASGGEPCRGRCPLDPQGSFAPLTIYLGAAPAKIIPLRPILHKFDTLLTLHTYSAQL